MMKRTLIALSGTLPVLATELPPAIPDGPVTYEAVSFESPDPSFDPYSQESAGTFMPDISGDPMSAPSGSDYSFSPTAPITPSVSSGNNGYIFLNAYTSNYNVRGLGFDNNLSRYGYSSISASGTLPNRNLFGCGIYQRISGSYGFIYGAGDELGDTQMAAAAYCLGKEIFPNLTLEVGYALHYGGFEGYMAKRYDGAAHRLSQDFNLTLAFNDHQKGIFGSMTWAWAFRGLNGIYGDIEIGYRFTNVLNGARLGADLELSCGIAPSFSYWSNSADGIDAYRLRAALPLFTHSGSLGRDARMQLIPWAQASWSGSNAAKIDRDTHGAGPIDHFIFTIGLDLGWNF